VLKGCTSLGCLGLVVIFVIMIIAASTSSNASKHDDAFDRPTPSTKHGWVTAAKFGHDVDFWESPEAMCRGIRAIAENIYEAQYDRSKADPNVADSLPGRADLGTGVRVRVLGHDGTACGSNTRIPLTRIEVTDGDSPLNGRRGYITEGLLSQQ